ncbi:exopolysaccharide transport family protein [Proteiniphilum acetatigenes]|uniref:exopolysaccharide transport family protein n=1 Tax=Proteiniphilum acetatigenes TaxID=294710 RepID=UPI0003722C57|nr:tyrosine-protein kinase [Proteiniphilum acetatigenes]
MNKYMGVEEEFMELSEKKIDVRAILMKYLSYWKWFVFSIVFFLGIAAAYIYFTLPQYQITTSILFKDDQKGGTTELNMEHNMGVVFRRNNVENEIEILKMSPAGEEVVRKNHLYATYIEMSPLFGLDKIIPNFPKRKMAVLYGDELPVKVILSEEQLNALGKDGLKFDLTANPDGNYLFDGKFNGQKYQVKASMNDSTVQLPFGRLQLSKGQMLPTEKRWIRVVIQHPLSVANGLKGSLDVKLTSRNSTVANITMTAPNRELGVNFLRDYIEAYNQQGIRDQLELAEKTAVVIDEHLANLSNELSSVEDQAQQFRQSRGLTDISTQANLYSSQLANVRQRRMDVETQLGIVSSLLSSVQQMSGHTQLIPANTGIQSAVLNSQITTYNDLVLERNRLSRIASGSNQSMINLNNQLQSTFSSVVSGLQSEKNTLEIQLRDINNEYSHNDAMVRAIPQQERAFSDIKRQQNIKEELFLYLLQKKEERYMNMTAVQSNSKLVDNIRVAGVAWPMTVIILIISLFLGVISPVIGIYIRDLFRFQLENKEELEKISSIPLLGEIPKTLQTGTVMVKQDNNDSFNEMVRLLRANLMFVVDGKDKKVINILSSVSGEGKSFVSINLGVSLALLDKKVLLVELDIRKPKLAKQLGLDSKQGMTLYLSGYMDKQELIKPSGIHSNLSVITAGSVPPNPNELLAKPALDELISTLKSEYDFIIIDTAPIGMVSDGFLLNRIADVNLFVTRAGVTPKKFVEDADRYFNENKIKKMYFILNSVNLNKESYRYGLYKKYGYGYA